MLFEKTSPLANKLRPEDFLSVVGQKKLILKLEKFSKPISMIFYGPAGTGKTTVAKILGKKWNLPFRELNATKDGTKEIKELSYESKKLGSLLLFLDEIHRFSSSQQDSLLSSIETGEFILIAATTENPAFRIIKPLLSRTQIFKFESLSEQEQFEILEKGILELKLNLEVLAKEKLVLNSGGDARKLLNSLESISLTDPNKTWKLSDVEDFFESQVFKYDKNKESHYDFISAFIKSIRGSDPDAAIYYLACMLEGGEDPVFICRRLVILASEDIGLASVNAVPLASSILLSVERIGMPESRILLSHLTLFLASSPKSNSSYRAIEDALEFVKKNGSSVQIPNHLRNAPSFIHKMEGASENYIYPHNEKNHFVLENYFPNELKNSPPQFFYPSEEGFEKTVKERIKNLWKDKK
jgi:putative ATPase